MTNGVLEYDIHYEEMEWPGVVADFAANDVFLFLLEGNNNYNALSSASRMKGNTEHSDIGFN
jgi:hypothetical protein